MHYHPELIDDAEQRTKPPAIVNSDIFGDVPGWIWKAFLSTWALMFALFLVFFTRDGSATMAVVTSCFFALMLLGLPAALGTQAKSGKHVQPPVIVTYNGPISTAAAATQILLIPVAGVIIAVGLVLFAL